MTAPGAAAAGDVPRPGVAEVSPATAPRGTAFIRSR